MLNEPHYNNTYFLKDHKFSYSYEGVFPDNLKCLNAIREAMIEYVNRLGDEKFEEGGWAPRIVLDGVDVSFWFYVGGPGSEPPYN